MAQQRSKEPNLTSRMKAGGFIVFWVFITNNIISMVFWMRSNPWSYHSSSLFRCISRECWAARAARRHRCSPTSPRSAALSWQCRRSWSASSPSRQVRRRDVTGSGIWRHWEQNMTSLGVEYDVSMSWIWRQRKKNNNVTGNETGRQWERNMTSLGAEYDVFFSGKWRQWERNMT